MSNALCVVSHVNTVDTRDQSKSCFNGSNTISNIFLSITVLIFNGFSIWKKFWTAENQGFPSIPNIHACQYRRYRHKISNVFNAMDVDTVDTNKRKDNTLD